MSEMVTITNCYTRRLGMRAPISAKSLIVSKTQREKYQQNRTSENSFARNSQGTSNIEHARNACAARASRESCYNKLVSRWIGWRAL